MDATRTVALAILAGLHAASYGAWKDSPFESFRPTRYWREIIIAGVAGAVLCTVDHLCTPFVIYLSTFSIARISTEFYKLFLRKERQDGFRIPTQVHLLGWVVGNRTERFVLGSMWLLAIYGLYALTRLFPPATSPHLAGPAIGLLFGVCLAVGGAFKDGYIEGFSLRKFLKSPIAGAVGGLIVSMHTNRLEFLVLGTIALERMFNELLFKLLRPGYVPGKFRSEVPAFPEWLAGRRRFLVPYAFTWTIAIWLWGWPLRTMLDVSGVLKSGSTE